MKKFILSSFIIISFGLYTAWNNTNDYSSGLITPLIFNSDDSSRITLDKISNISQNKSKNFSSYTITKKSSNYNSILSSSNSTRKRAHLKKKIMMKKMGIYNDGQYTGKITDAYYGNMQVKIVIANGKLTDIKMLDYPHNNGNSNYINSYALPILKREAIQIQSANIDGVSGASASSPAFIKTLASALKKAKA